MSKLKKKPINVKDILKKFDIQLENEKLNLNYLDIAEPAIKRIGLELANQITNTRFHKNIICWGTNEDVFFNKHGKEKSYQILNRVLKYQPPMIILSKGIKVPVKDWIVDVATKYGIPVHHSKNSVAKITTTIGTYLNDYYSEEVQVHGCLVSIGGIGVLIVGEPGIGKSEATLELIQKGHMFVADDAVLVKHIGSHFYGSAPFITKNFLEVRGIGIIDVKYTYGIKSIMNGSIIDLVIELVNYEEGETNLDRIGLYYLKYYLLDGSILKIKVPMRKGSSGASLIEAAVSAYLAHKDGIDASKIMDQRRGEADE